LFSPFPGVTTNDGEALAMSTRNEDNSPSHEANTGNDDGTAETGLLPLPVAHVANLPTNVNAHPSSTRTSVTRVEHDDEARSRPSITNDLVATLAGTTTHETANTASHSSPVHEEERTISSQSTPEPESSQGEAVVNQQAGEAAEAVPQTPQIYVTFLLISGKRRTLAFEPSTTIARVKELAWNSWPAGMSFIVVD
jgi:hypothetical protein